MFFFLIVLLFFLNLSSLQADDSYKLLIPNELDFENPEQKKNEIYNFSRSGLTHFEWRKRKCYRDVVFNIFWKSKLCPGDPSICIHSYTVEELHTFYNYYNYLLDISELCADGYQLDNDDRSFFKNSSQDQVDLFKKHVKETREKLIDYTKEFSGELKFKEKRNEKIKRNNAAHGAVSNPNRNISEKELKDIEKEIIEEEKELANKKNLLQEEKKLLEKKRELKKMLDSIQEAEKLLKRKRESSEN